MRPMPRDPFCQIATQEAKQNRIESTEQASAPKNVASAGFTSRKPKRTMRIETTTATTENTARLRAQEARLDTGSDWAGTENLRARGRNLPGLNVAGRNAPGLQNWPV